MALRPFSATLQQNFRNTLGTVGAPEAIDDSIPVQAVAVVASNGPISASGAQIVQEERSTVLAASASVTGATGNTTIGTVPTGFVWRIVGYTITSVSQITTNALSRCEMQFNAVVYGTQAVQSGGLSYGNFTGEKTVMFPKGNEPVLTAGQIARLAVALVSGSDNALYYATVFYVQEAE